MSRGGSYGGGQSSLGYLFGSNNDKQEEGNAPPPSPTLSTPPPYGIDTNIENQPKFPIFAPPKEQNVSNNYQRTEGQNSGNFITERPSTKVKSVPGGDSSLGYLFGDK